MSNQDDYPIEMNAFAEDDELIEQLALGQLRSVNRDPLVALFDELQALQSAPAPAMSEALTAALLSDPWDTPKVERMTAAVVARVRKGVSGYLPYAVGAAAAAVIFTFAHGSLSGDEGEDNSPVAADPHTITVTPDKKPADHGLATTAPDARQGGGRSVNYVPTVTKTPTVGTRGTTGTTGRTPAPTPSPEPVTPPPTSQPPQPDPEASSGSLIDGVTGTVAALLSIPVDLLT